MKLTRSRDDRMVAGVCSGVAKAYGLDVNLVRVLTVLLSLLGSGVGVIAYVLMALLLPLEGKDESPLETLMKK